MLDRVKAFHTANIFEPHIYNHILGRPSLSMDPSTDVCASRCNFQVVRIMQDGRSDLYATGKYLDSIVFEKGSPKFQERIVVLDFTPHRYSDGRANLTQKTLRPNEYSKIRRASGKHGRWAS